jgi:serine/threonine protein kinase
VDPAQAEIGATANSYQVLAKLATGGMAELYLARVASVAGVQRYVVMKRVLRDHASDIRFLRMFLDEARLAAQLQHPNIAQVHDVGKLGDSYFFTMEYVHGETVRALLHRAHEMRRSPPLGSVLAVVAGAAAGLHHAHERIGVDGRPLGIVHRDVSPSNLMVGYDGSVKLVDFGVAKAEDRETKSGAVKGKIAYLSPEQARGQKLDRRSDLFSLGIVMWEMVTTERLYPGSSDYETMSRIISEPTPPPSSRRRDVPPALDALVLRALAKSPDERFQTAEEITNAIEDVAVQTGSSLSAASLARFVRELFGQPPEPWLTLAAPERRAEVVTVTAEPIPAELSIPLNDPVDRRLAAVVDLSVVGRPLATTVRMPTAEPSVSSRAQSPPADTVAGATSVVIAPPPQAQMWWRSPWLIGSAIVAVALIAALIIAWPRDEVLATSPVASARVENVVITPIERTPIAVPESAPVDAAPAPAPVVEPPRPPEPPASPVKPPAKPVHAVRPPPRPAKDLKDKVDVIKQFETSHYAEVIEECTASSVDPVLCTLAACHLHDVAKARRWLGRVPTSEHARVVTACGAAGVTLDEAHDKSYCLAHPLECPH